MPRYSADARENQRRELFKVFSRKGHYHGKRHDSEQQHPDPTVAVRTAKYGFGPAASDVSCPSARSCAGWLHDRLAPLGGVITRDIDRGIASLLRISVTQVTARCALAFFFAIWLSPRPIDVPQLFTAVAGMLLGMVFVDCCIDRSGITPTTHIDDDRR